MQTTAIKQSMGLAEWAMLLGLSVIWGGSFFFNRVAVAELPVFIVVAGRVGIAALILWAIVLITQTPLPREPKIYWQLLFLGLVNSALPFSFIVWGQTHIGSGLASIINATTPFFTIIIANRLLQDEKLTWLKLAGVIIGIAGVAAMMGVSALSASGDHLIYELALIASSICYGIGSTYARRFRNLPPLVIATGQISGASVIILPAAFIIDAPLAAFSASWPALASILALAALSTAFAYLLYFRVLRSSGATNVALVTFMVPVSAILLGILFLNETLELRQLGGMAAIGLGLALIDGRLWRALTGKKPN